MQTTQRPHEALLRYILGILSMPQHAVAKTEYLTAVHVDQSQHCRLVAAQASIHQLTHVVGQTRFLRLFSRSKGNTTPKRPRFQAAGDKKALLAELFYGRRGRNARKDALTRAKPPTPPAANNRRGWPFGQISA
jgi:hypothetical protein